jgi:hypothetical protein
MTHRFDRDPLPTCTTADVVHHQPPCACYQPRSVTAVAGLAAN